MMNAEGNSSIIPEFMQKIDVGFSSNINNGIAQSKSNFVGTLMEVTTLFRLLGIC